MTESRPLFGRTVIYTDAEVVDSTNVVEVLDKALWTHQVNSADIQYLWDYYRGKQPILDREKDIRPEICNKIVENRANEIVTFKVSYLMGEPVQYVNRSGRDEATDALNALNEFVFAEDKAAKDKELAEWFHICGTSYRMVLPDKMYDSESDDSPFEIFTLDPRYAFVIYHSGLGHKPVAGVKYVVTEKEGIIYSVYTDREYFEIVDGNIRKKGKHTIGAVPIVEYPANNARLGAFEIVLPLLDAINEVESNRVDGIAQFIEALLMLKGVDIEADDFANLKALGGIKVPIDGDVKYLTQELNQDGSQTVVDNMYNTVLTICGMPNRNGGGGSTSDTGTATIMRDGWFNAEGRAKDSEMQFRKSEKVFLKIALRIANTLQNLKLKLSDIEIRFTRRNYENISEKANVLSTLLSLDKVHPRLAFEHSGLFVDPDVAYTMSAQYYEEHKAEMMAELNKREQIEDDEEEDTDAESEESSTVG